MTFLRGQNSLYRGLCANEMAEIVREGDANIVADNEIDQVLKK